MHTHSLPPTDRDEIAEPKRSKRFDEAAINEGLKSYPEHQAKTVKRFWKYYWDNSLTLATAADLIDRDDSTLGEIFRGQYGARPDHVIEAMGEFLELQEKRDAAPKVRFVETGLAKRIFMLCDRTRVLQKMSFIIGETHVGKTEPLMEYERRNNHGKTIYTRCPSDGSVKAYAEGLAVRFGISTKTSRSAMKAMIMKEFRADMLLIVDELSACIQHNPTAKRRVQIMEFVREIFDRTKCSVVGCATPIFRKEMQDGEFSRLFAQCMSRRFCMMEVKPKTPQADLNLYAAAYGLPPSSGPARELETQVIESERLGHWLTLLQIGSSVAANEKKPFSWSHVLSAKEGLDELEGRGGK